MTVAYIGLGSNVGDRLSNLRRAVKGCEASGIVVQEVSSVYETVPVGPPQPDFLNAVVRVWTELGAKELVETLKKIEAEIGRTESARWGPREIDLDLLLYGDEAVTESDVKVPHPQMLGRAFVLVPLLEIAPFVAMPSGEPIAQFLELEAPGVERYASPQSIAS